MQLALMTEPQLGGTYDDLLAAALWAEENGLVSFARSDHYYWTGDPAPPASDAFTTLGGIARETSTIRLAVLVSPLTFRHPAVMAKSASSLDEMSGGRFDLGVGTGWMELEHDALGLPFPPWSERFARLEEALPYLHQTLRAERASFEGAYYSVDATVRPLAPNVGLIVGGSGPSRTPRLAGRWADDYNTFLRPIDDIAAKIAVVRQSATEAGRNPDDIICSVMGSALVAPDRASFNELLAEEAAQRDKDPGEVEALFRERGIPVGTTEEAAEHLAALEAAGVTRWYVQAVPHDLETIKRLVEPLLSL